MAENIRPETAIRAAKAWLAKIYADERIAGISLEEVRFRNRNWEITLGFYRHENGDSENSPFRAVVDALGRRREYKVVVVAGDDNHVIEMRAREIA